MHVCGEVEMRVGLMELCTKFYCICSSVFLTNLLHVSFHRLCLLNKPIHFFGISLNLLCKHTVLPLPNSDLLQEIQEWATSLFT